MTTTTPASLSVRLLVLIAAILLLIPPGPARGQTLFTNGPIVTNPVGGTGAIAGQPISQADGFTIPGQTFVFSTLGVNASVPVNTAVAEDFTVPDLGPGGGWRLDRARLFAFQTSQTTPTVTAVRLNLWTAAPFSANSPGPVPSPLPQPLLAQAVEVPVGTGTFVAHRQSPSGTSTVRPVFAYDVPLDALLGTTVLGAGTYWLEWSFVGASSPSANVFVPLVSPRTSAENLNARLFNSLDGSPGGERVWFEGREGFVAGVSDGRPYALAFELEGQAIPSPASGLTLALAAVIAARRRRAGI